MKTAGQPAVFMLENGGDNKSKPMSHLGNGVPVQSGHVAIPGSKNPDHIRDNFDIFDFALTDEEMAEIAKLDKGVRCYGAPAEPVTSKRDCPCRALGTPPKGTHHVKKEKGYHRDCRRSPCGHTNCGRSPPRAVQMISIR